MTYKIPLFKLNYDHQEIEAITDVIKSKWISTGPKCVELENTFSQLLNANYAVSLSNCTVALHLAMKLLDIKEGDEVICPSLTFVATVNAIKYVNAIPVFTDIVGIDNVTINPKEIVKLITSKTKAIIVMHYAGFPCDMDAIMKISKEYNLKIIEDACHAPLSEYKGRKLGTIGDIGCFSFFSNKNISTGEGGILVTNNEKLYLKAKLLRSHGMTTMSYQRATGHATEYNVIEAGFNYRMDDMHASLAIVQLSKVKDDLVKRKNVRAWYLDGLKHNSKIVIPFIDNTEFVSNYIFPIVIQNISKEKRDEIRESIHNVGIQTSLHYPPVHKFEIYKQYKSDLKITEAFADSTLTLPMYGSLNIEDVNFICEQINLIIKN